MKQKQRQMAAIFTLLMMLLSLLIGCGPVTDVSSEYTESVENVETTEAKETTGEYLTVPTTEESGAEETTIEEPTENTSEAPLVQVELSIDAIKEPLYTFSWGEESGQLGWSENYIGEFQGPRAFAVEDGVLYILDNENDRIMIMEDGRITEINSEYFRGGCELICQNQMIAVSDITGSVVEIYRRDGALVHMVDYRNVKDAPFIIDLIEIGETYVVWYDWDAKALYRYDWVKDSGKYVDPDELSVEYLKTVKVNAPVRRDMVEVLGMDKTGIYYFYPDMSTLRHYLICRETDDTQWIAAWDFSGKKPQPLSPFYYSDDGELYLMECFDEQVIISKLTME